MFEVEGIIIKSTPFKENDAMITLLSEDNIYSFLAKGVLKANSKNAACVRIYSLVRLCLYKGKDGLNLRSGTIIDGFSKLTSSLNILLMVKTIGEITNLFLQKEDCKKVYIALKKSLTLLNESFSPSTVLLLYFAYMLRISGYGVEVDKCVKCSNKSQITSFSYRDGGFICHNCFEPSKHEIKKQRYLKIMRYIFKVEPSQFDHIAFNDEESKFILNELDDFLYQNTQTRILNLKLVLNA